MFKLLIHWFKTKAKKMCCHCAQIGIRSVCAIFSVPLCHAYFLSGPYHQMQLRRYFFSSSHFKSKLFCLFFVLLPSHLRRGQGGFSPPPFFDLWKQASFYQTHNFEVCICCSWRCPWTYMSSVPHLMVSYYLWSFGTNFALRLRALEGAVSSQKVFQGSEIKTRDEHRRIVFPWQWVIFNLINSLFS